MDAILVNRKGNYCAVLLDLLISNILIKLSVRKHCFLLYIYKEIANNIKLFFCCTSLGLNDLEAN